MHTSTLTRPTVATPAPVRTPITSTGSYTGTPSAVGSYTGTDPVVGSYTGTASAVGSYVRTQR